MTMRIEMRMELGKEIIGWFGEGGWEMEVTMVKRTGIGLKIEILFCYLILFACQL